MSPPIAPKPPAKVFTAADLDDHAPGEVASTSAAIDGEAAVAKVVVAAEGAPKAPAAKRSWLDKGVHASKVALSQRMAPVNFGVSVGGMAADLHFQGQLNTQVALLPTDELVTSNPDRKEAAGKGTTWMRVGAIGAGGAGLAGLGLDRGLKVSAVVPTASKVTGKSLVQLGKDQLQLLTLEFHPDKIGNYPAGSEFLIEGYKMKSAALVPGAAVSTFGLNAGVEGGVDGRTKETAYSKSVLVHGDNSVGIRIEKSDEKRSSVGAGAGIGFGIIDGDGTNKAGDFSNEKNHVNIFSAYVGKGKRDTKTVTVVANPDMSTKAGKAGYSALMEIDPNSIAASPEGARDALEKKGMKAAYFDRTKEKSGFGGHLTVGKHNLFTIGSNVRTSEGVLLEMMGDGRTISEKKMTEAEYSRTVTGLLPRWVKGEERDVSLVTVPLKVNGNTMRGLVMSLAVTDPEVTTGEQQQYSKFAEAMGTRGESGGKAKAGKGTLSAQMLVTDAGFAKLDKLGSEGFKAAFTNMLEQTNGKLPWNDASASKPVNRAEKYQDPVSIQERYARAVKATEMRSKSEVEGGGEQQYQATMTEYYSSVGHSFYEDQGLQLSIGLLAKEFDATKGKSIDERGPFLTTLSRLSAPAVRAALALVRKEADGKVIEMNFESPNLKFAIEPEVAGPQRMGEVAEETLRRASGAPKEE